jgi:hypothetical protein
MRHVDLQWLREFRMGERLERFGRNAERFARNDSNGERNGERFARNDSNGERNAERLCTKRFSGVVVHFWVCSIGMGTRPFATDIYAR